MTKIWHAPCKGCGATKTDAKDEGTWWHLTKFKTYSGTYCPTCYDRIAALDETAAKVAHALEGKPK